MAYKGTGSMKADVGNPFAPDHLRVLRIAAKERPYQPSLDDWGDAEECVDLGLLGATDLEGAEPGTLASIAYDLTPRGVAALSSPD